MRRLQFLEVRSKKGDNDMEVVGLILAGGSGTRLLPFTKFTHKTLLPIYDSPVIDYAISTMRKAKIGEITIVANKHIVQISEHIGKGLKGETIRYVLEERPTGVRDALELARSHIEGKRVLLYFSDNITNWSFADDAESFRRADSPPGAVLLVREVDSPEEFGICVFDSNGQIVDIVEKPKEKMGNQAVGGIYLFDETLFDRIDGIVQNESFSISDVTRQYVSEGRAQIRNIGLTTWVDCGTPVNLLYASELARDGKISTYESY